MPEQAEMREAKNRVFYDNWLTAVNQPKPTELLSGSEVSQQVSSSV